MKHFKLNRLLMLLVAFLTMSINLWGETYTKVTSTSGLSVGSEYIIVSGSTYAVSTSMNGTNGLSLTAVTAGSDDKISYSGTSVAVFSLGGNSTDGYTLLLGTKYFSANGTNNKSRLLDSKSASGESAFTISFVNQSGSLNLVTKQSSVRCLRANSTTDVRFYSGQTSTNGNVVYLYKKDVTDPATIILSEAGFESTVSGTHYVGDSYELPDCKASCGDKVFVGWSTVEIPVAGAKPTSNYYEKGATVTLGASNKFYAVFADQAVGAPVETKAQTLQYDTWTYSGSTSNKNGYRLFHSGSYIESASFDRSKLSKVIVYGGTFGGTSNNKLTIGDGTNTWKSVTVSGSSESGTNTYTNGTALSGTGTIRITSNSGSNSGSGSGVRISKVEIFTMEGGTTYSDYVTSCVTKYDVTFNMNGKTADAIAKQSLAEGEEVTKPTDPTTTGYTFDAWYKESACTNTWDFLNDKVGTEDIELFAKWDAIQYDIFYKDGEKDYNWGETVHPTQHTYDQSTTLVAAPNKEGYTFEGWYKEPELTNKVTTLGATDYTDAITLYAKWTVIPANPCVVTFYVGEHGTCETAYITEETVGAGVTLPTVTAAEGWAFKGWSTTNPATAETLVAAGDDGKYHILENTPLYAYYKVIPATPTVSVAAGAIEKGTEVELSCATDGATIYYTTNGDEPTSASTVYSAAIVLNANQTIRAIAILDGENSDVTSAAYTIAKHETKFYVNGEQLGETQSLAKGDAVVFPEKSAVTNVSDEYEFMGWYGSAYTHATDAPTYVTEATMGTSALNYYAVFAQGKKGETTYTKLASNSFVSGAEYVLAAEETSDVKTLHYFSSYSSTTANESWGVTSTNVEKAIIFTLSGTADALVAKDASNNYIQALATGKFRMSSTSTTLKLNNDGKISNPSSTSYYMRYNDNSGAGGFRWYNNATGTSAYFYKKDDGTTYSNYCTSVKAVTDVAIKTDPTTADYCEGEKFNPEGLEVTLTYEGGATKDVTYAGNEGKFTFAPALDAALTTSDDHVAITINGQTVNYTISVRSVKIIAPVVEEGSYTVKVGEAEAVTAAGNPIAAKKGQKIVLSSIAAEGYRPQGTPFEVKDEDDAKVSVSTAGGQYSFTMPDKDVTITAKFSKLYTLTAATTIANGSIAIKDKDNNVITEHVNNGKVVVVVTSDPHYTLSSLYYVKDGLDAVEEANRVAITQDNDVYTFMMPQSNVTIYATFTEDEKHDAIFYVNGSESSRATTYTGEKVVFPTTKPEAPSTCAEKVFVGWTETSEYDDEKNAPTYVSDYTMANADKIFYAVFAEEVGDPTSFIKGSVSNLGTGIKVLLVHNDKAVSSSASKDNYLGAGNVTINNSKINCSDESLIWTVTKNESTYKFDQGASKILNVNASGLYANTTDGSFVISVKNSSYELKDANVTAYIDYWGADGFSKLTMSHNDNTIDFYVPDVTYVNYSTICAECQNAIMITKGAETNGTFTLSKEGEVCLDKKPEGYSVTVKATPAEHHHLASVTTTSGVAGEIADNQCVVSGITANTTITAVFAEDTKYTVNWEVNGLVVKTENLYADVAVSAPAVEAINGKVFRGWVAEKIEGTIPNAADVDFVDVADKTISNLGVSEEETTYYAVFATKAAGADASVEFSVSSITSIQQTIAEREQTTDDGITFTFSLVGTTGTGNATVQMSKSSTLTQNIAFAGNIKSIKFEGFAYSSTKDASMLVEGKKGTDGTYSTVQSCGSTYNGSDISFNGKNYDFFKITVGSERTVKFTKMTVSYEGVGYSDFCTAVAIEPIIGTGGWSTFCRDFNYTVDNGTAFIATEVNISEGVIVLTPLDEGTVIPAGAGIAIQAEENANYTITPSAETAADLTDNQFVGTIVRTPKDTRYDWYAISTFGEVTGFARIGTGVTYLPAGKAFLNVANGQAAPARFGLTILNRPNDPLATGVEQTTSSEGKKMLINNRLVIIRGDKMFDANGRLLK